MAFANLGITSRSLTHEDLPFLHDFLANICTSKEPVMSALKITPEAHKSFTIQFEHNYDFSISRVACLPSGEIIACFLAAPFDSVTVDVSKVDPSVMGSLGLAYSLIDGFKEILEKRNAEGPQLRVINLISGATADAYENMGINKMLRGEVIEKAKKAGWDMATVQCSNRITQHLMRDVYGFTVAKEVSYPDYEEGGKKPYAAIEGSTMILYKDLK